MEKVAVGSAVDISISVVSHLQIGMVVELLRDFEDHCRDSRFELILTLNLEEALPFAPDDFSYPVIILRNAKPLGFGANHNQAFQHASGRYFCVVNRISVCKRTHSLTCSRAWRIPRWASWRPWCGVLTVGWRTVRGVSRVH